MAGDTQITIVGNLVKDPELRFTPAGASVCSFTVASTPRTYDKQSQQWVDGEAMFLACQVWREPAENAAETLLKGMRVIVSGRLKARSFETRDGDKRTVFEVDVEEVGPSLRYASAQVAKTSGGRRQGQRQDPRQDSRRDDRWGGQQRRDDRGSRQESRGQDPWAASPPLPEEPPF